jgi:molybdenum cofactor cytidylyltransferase
MGKPKLLLPWNKMTVLEHTVATWARLGARQVAVVWSDSQPEIPQVLGRIAYDCAAVKNPQTGADMWSSIQTAARWNGWSEFITHVAVVLGDQPHVRSSTLEIFLDSIRFRSEKTAWQPVVNGKRCHPVVLKRSLFAKLSDSPGPTLRDFMDQHTTATELVPTADEALLRDIDSPEDWDELAPGSHNHSKRH